MKLKESSTKKKCDLPDILEILNISRTFIRQLELLSKVEVPPEYKSLVKAAIEKVNVAANNFKDV